MNWSWVMEMFAKKSVQQSVCFKQEMTPRKNFNYPLGWPENNWLFTFVNITYFRQRYLKISLPLRNRCAHLPSELSSQMNTLKTCHVGANEKQRKNAWLGDVRCFRTFLKLANDADGNFSPKLLTVFHFFLSLNNPFLLANGKSSFGLLV